MSKAWYFAATKDQAKQALDIGQIGMKVFPVAINRTEQGLHVTADLDTANFWAEALGPESRVLVVEIPTKDVLMPDGEDVRSLLYQEWGEHKELETRVRNFWYDSVNKERKEVGLGLFESIDAAWKEFREFLDVKDESDYLDIDGLTTSIAERDPSLALSVVDALGKGVYPGTLIVIGSIDNSKAKL